MALWATDAVVVLQEHLIDSLSSVSLEVTPEEAALIDKDGDQGEGLPPWQT